MQPVIIVLVEDDAGHARLIEKNIRRAGVVIMTFAISKTERPRWEHLLANGSAPTLVLLDLNLPDMSGTQILEKLKSADDTKHIPIIVLTTTDDKAEIQNAMIWAATSMLPSRSTMMRSPRRSGSLACSCR